MKKHRGRDEFLTVTETNNDPGLKNNSSKDLIKID